MRNGPHLDRGKHRLAQPAAAENVLERPHRLIVAHVLIDGERDAGAGAQGDALAGFTHAQCQRLLRQDAANVVAVGDGPTNDMRLHVRRDGDIQDFDVGIGQELADRAMDARNLMLGRDRLGAGPAV